VRLLTEAQVSAYLAHDKVLEYLDAHSTDDDESLTSQNWLRDSAPKRAVFDQLYGDLLESDRKRILDVGGGLSSLTRLLATRHDYELNDVMAHEDPASIERFRSKGPAFELHDCDWFEMAPAGNYDVVIANDIFPNVDQRLAAFIARFLPRCRELRISLTFYNDLRFYLTRRIQGDEVLCMLAWDGDSTRTALMRNESRVIEPDWELFDTNSGSVFANGRQVCSVTLRGDLSTTDSN